MKTFYKSSIGLLFGLALCLAFVGVARAQTIEVDFEQNPLFAGGGELSPGDTITRSFTVHNTGSDARTVYVRTLNDSHTEDLAEALEVNIVEVGNGSVYTGTLHDLFIRDNKSDSVPLSLIPAGNSKEYEMTVTFAAGSGNGYQNGTANFDLCIGFNGGNENCITGTGDPDVDNPDNDNDDNSGGGGENNNNNDDNDLPPGIVEGESTSTPATFADNFIQPFTDFLRGMVLGESTSAQELATTTIEETDEFDDGLGEPSRTSSPVSVLVDERNCLLGWLLLLALISFAWSVYEDKYRNSGAAFGGIFVRNAIFTGVYAAATVLFHFLELLDIFWWLLAGAWVVTVALDYRAHRPLMTAAELLHRVLYFGAAGIFFILTSFLFGFPCEWWPFFIILCGAGLTYFFDLFE